MTVRKAVILAGGLGERLKPFTQVIPKPLLPVGESSILELQILGLRRAGIDHIYIATNYRADFISAFLGDGSRYGLTLTYSREDKPLGTCGPVLLLRDQLNEPFLLMNGDILTTVSFESLFALALSVEADLVVGTTQIVAPFHFGKVVCQGDLLVDVEEKPDFRMEILAGIYVLKPGVFSLIPPDTYFGIDHLIKEMLARRLPVARYFIREYWLDIGRMSDYESAQTAYQAHFTHLKNREK